MPRFATLLLLACWAAVPSALAARTPEEVVTAYYAAAKTTGLSALVPLMHPEELARFRVETTPVLAQAIRDPGARTVFAAFVDPVDRARVRSLPDAPFFSAFIQAIDVIQPDLSRLLRNATAEVLGSVRERDLTHVLVRVRLAVGATTVEQLNVITTRPSNGEPMLLLTGEVRGVVDLIRRQEP